MSSVITTLTVTGMTCGKCAARVKGALGKTPGVESADVDQPSGTAKVTHAEGVPADALVAAVVTAGYAAAVSHEGKLS